MIKHPATRLVAAFLIIGGLAIAPLLNNDDPEEEAQTSAPAVPSPRFEVIWRNDELRLNGHTLSETHENNLREAAASAYPKAFVDDHFEALGVVPAHWADTTLQLVYLLADTVSSDATLTEDELTIRSVTVNESGWQDRLSALQEALPADITIKSESLAIDEAINTSAVCSRAFQSFSAGPINFAESSSEFLSSAFPRLDRVVALASACRKSRLSITGHTDASGDETWNQQLSLARANAVADYIAASGIDRTRLDVAGVGSVNPIADDSTRYGRSLNRRIEIALIND